MTDHSTGTAPGRTPDDSPLSPPTAGDAGREGHSSGLGLADTAQPGQLIPADAAPLRELVHDLRVDAATLTEGASTLTEHAPGGDRWAGWAGDGADAARMAAHDQAGRFNAAATSAGLAAAALDRHADLIDWAHRQAREAAALYADAKPADSADGPANIASTASAFALFDRARDQVDTVSRDTVAALTTARNALPDTTRLLRDPDTPTPTSTAGSAVAPPRRHSTPTTPGLRGPHEATATIAATTDAAGATASVATPVAAHIGHTSAEHAATVQRHVITVERGDTLTGLAAQYLGDSRRWHEIFELNRGLPQTDGSSLDRVWLLHPGWTLAMPDTPPTPLPDGDPDQGPDRGPDRGPDPVPWPDLSPTLPGPTAPDPGTDSPGPEPGDSDSGDGADRQNPAPGDNEPGGPIASPPRPPTPPPAPPPGTGDPHASEGTTMDVATVAAIGGGGAVVALAALMLARRHHPAAGLTGLPARAAFDSGLPPVVRPARRLLPGPPVIPRPAPPSTFPQPEPRRYPPATPPPGTPPRPGPRQPGPPPARPPYPPTGTAYPPQQRRQGQQGPRDGVPEDPTRPRQRPTSGAVVLPLASHPGQPVHHHDLTAAAGLCLTGDPDTITATARALLVAALTTPSTALNTRPTGTGSSDTAPDTAPAVTPIAVAIAAEDAPVLIGADYAAHPAPAWLHITPNLATWWHQHPHPDRPWMLLIRSATAATYADHFDLDHLVHGAATPEEATATSGPAVVVLGAWPTARTQLSLDATAVITRATGPNTAHLAGTTAYRLGQPAVRSALRDLAPPTAITEPPAIPESTPDPGTRNTDPIADSAVTDRAPTAEDESPARTEPAGNDSDAAAPVSQKRTRPPTTTIPPASPPPLRLTLFGPPRLTYHAHAATQPPGETAADLSASLSARKWELLLHIATHLPGDRRDTIITDIWGDTAPTRPTNTINTALGRLRKTIADATSAETVNMITSLSDNRYGLNPDLITTDYATFTDAIHQRRIATTRHERETAGLALLNTYAGPLADGHDAEWIASIRKDALRHALDTADSLAQLFADTDPDQAVSILEFAITLDPLEEETYRKLIALQRRLDRPGAAKRTYATLVEQLESIDSSPKMSTRSLVESSFPDLDARPAPSR
ncbi:putative T7SS-secreted protein [Pseudonocardia sp. CA-107938]|uniref:putative T7SS-secreted protein n=1 Tax=Pseudonocardia sp. CA-107938 TaxID=3240021 RepID=UPI003D903457